MCGGGTEPHAARVLEPQRLADDVPTHCVKVTVRTLDRARRVEGVDAARGVHRVDGGFGGGRSMQARAP